MKEMRLSLRSIEAMNCGHRPIILCRPHSTQSIFFDMFEASKGICKRAHCMLQLPFQLYATLTYLIFCLGCISQIAQDRMTHSVTSKRYPTAILHFMYFWP